MCIVYCVLCCIVVLLFCCLCCLYICLCVVCCVVCDCTKMFFFFLSLCCSRSNRVWYQERHSWSTKVADYSRFCCSGMTVWMKHGQCNIGLHNSNFLNSCVWWLFFLLFLLLWFSLTEWRNGGCNVHAGYVVCVSQPLQQCNCSHTYFYFFWFGDISGVLHLEGTGVKQDVDVAHDWFDKVEAAGEWMIVNQSIHQAINTITIQ